VSLWEVFGLSFIAGMAGALAYGWVTRR